MGFKPGQSLGRVKDPPTRAVGPSVATLDTSEPAVSAKTFGHLIEPLPLDVWSGECVLYGMCYALLTTVVLGRQGVGKRKRAVSPTVAGKLAKVVQQADKEEQARGSYRERARQEYEERRAEGRLVTATQTCITFDEKADKAVGI